jgi:hypothetical protein
MKPELSPLRILLPAALSVIAACSSERISHTNGPTGPDAEPAVGPDAAAPALDAGAVEEDASDFDAGIESDAGAPDLDAGSSQDAVALDGSIATSTTPPPLKPYSGGACPMLISGPTSDTSLNPSFMSSGDSRAFRLLVPPSYDGMSDWPVVFLWHWLNASSASYISDGELETATEEMHFIAVLPDQLRDASGHKVYQLDWPFAEFWGAPKELVFFDDLLTCVSQQFRVDPRRVYANGVSSGGLWAAYLSTTDRAQYLAAVETLSGGLAEIPPAWQMTYVPQPNKFPTLVLWGGPSDWFIVSFSQASMRYRDALIGDHHFVVTCTHDSGHAIPPIEPPPGGGTRFRSMWEFLLAHPYGLAPGQSPWQATGLPADFPTWCSIATP